MFWWHAEYNYKTSVSKFRKKIFKVHFKLAKIRILIFTEKMDIKNWNTDIVRGQSIVIYCSINILHTSILNAPEVTTEAKTPKTTGYK